MADWYFGSHAAYLAAPYSPRDGTSPGTAWHKGTNTMSVGTIDLAQLSAGDTLWVMDDHDTYLVDDILQGTYPDGVTIRGDYPGRPGTLRVGGVNTSTNITIRDIAFKGTVNGGSFGFNTIDGALLENVEISEMGKGLTCGLDTNVDNVTIRGCHFHHLSDEGIEVFCHTAFTRDGWLIEENYIHHVGPSGDSEAIGLQRITNSIIRNNTMHDCEYGINIWESGDASSHDLEISKNRIYNILLGDVAWPSRGIMTSGGATEQLALYNFTIRDNLLFNIGREGIRNVMPAGSPGNVCTGNVIANVNVEYGTPNTEYISQSVDWTLFNNRTLTSWPRSGRKVTTTRRRGRR